MGYDPNVPIARLAEKTCLGMCQLPGSTDLIAILFLFLQTLSISPPIPYSYIPLPSSTHNADRCCSSTSHPQGCSFYFCLGCCASRPPGPNPGCVSCSSKPLPTLTRTYTVSTGITEAFKADKDPKKINLGVGAYRVRSFGFPNSAEPC